MDVDDSDTLVSSRSQEEESNVPVTIQNATILPGVKCGLCPVQAAHHQPRCEKKLLDFLHKTVVYKKAENYIHAKDNHYVERFNNGMLVYHDKWICFRRCQLPVAGEPRYPDWNDHVDREFTSVWLVENAANPRKQQPKKQLVRKAYKLR
ncbi:Hypp6843 [Branchiostoma lanceolatum]|uniref:Hypp6843 protein n=1 Tax=Branchiostoma lanceolatum TaxID=7740 RepID=A0A8J9YVP4_BRALA|nr:Hypp6843 [Branchiostoma lanceolatum]